MRPEDRLALYVEIARRKADAADKSYDEGNAEAGKAALQDVLIYSQKATDSSIATGKKQKDTEIILRKMAMKFRDVKRTVAFEDQAPIQQADGRVWKKCAPTCSLPCSAKRKTDDSNLPQSRLLCLVSSGGARTRRRLNVIR